MKITRTMVRDFIVGAAIGFAAIIGWELGTQGDDRAEVVVAACFVATAAAVLERIASGRP